MQKDTPEEEEEEYDLFYMELPQSDYFLTDIPISDAYDEDENTDENQRRGLSAEQVSELIEDQLGDQRQPHRTEQNLFSSDGPQS